MRGSAVVAVAAPSRDDSPEFAHALQRTPLTFDAELAAELFSELFTQVEVERWDAPLLELPDAVAVRDYLRGKGVSRQAAERTAAATRVPIRVTKRGASCSRASRAERAATPLAGPQDAGMATGHG
jgi:hypothetical protein